MKNILALDLGTHAGYAFDAGVFATAQAQLCCGTWTLATAREITQWGKLRLSRRCDPRIIRFYDHVRMFNPGIIVFEDVQFASSTYQVQLWASLRAVIWLTFPDRIIDCVPVATLKKFATGHGGATKPMMSASLRRKHPALWSASLDDNAVDAAWLWLWAKQNLGRL